MKAIKTKVLGISLALAAILAMPACKPGQTTVIKTSDDNSYQTIEYSGRVVFNADKTGIESISDGGHLLFDRNGNKLQAEADDKGHVRYRFNGDDEVDVLTPEQKSFVNEAVKAIVKEKARLSSARN